MIATTVPSARAIPDPPTQGIRLVTPTEGRWVSRAVALRAVTEDPTVAVRFEVALDGEDNWIPVGTDTDGSDGWRATWRTLGYNGRARIRASSVGLPATKATIRVRVDNDRPRAKLAITPRLFSPNGDGRRDRTVIRLASNEPTRARLALKARSTIRKRWSVQLGEDRPRKIPWSGKRLGRHLPDGSYRLTATVEDRVGLRTSVHRRLRIDRTPPRLKLLRVRPRPSSDPERAHMRYRSWDKTKRLRARVKVIDSVGTIGTNRRRHKPGKHTLSFPTRYRNGDKLFPGDHSALLTVTDAAGNRSRLRYRWRVHRAMKARFFERLDGTGRKVALTFDDCHVESAWRGILDTLRRWKRRATFFCPGDRIMLFPDLARRTVREGHAVGSHGWDHSLLTTQSFESIRWRLIADRRAWIKYGGATSAPYFRPPNGAYNSTVMAAAGATSHARVVNWDIDSRDGVGASGGTLICNVVCDARPGSIILMHTTGHSSDALPQILAGLKNRNLEPVSLPELFRASGRR